jgi:hypothetical protein
MFLRRIGRGGLIQAAATTAVVAGTATAVSGGIRSLRAARDRQAYEAQAYEDQQQQAGIDAAVQQSVAAQQASAPTVARGASGMTGLPAQLQHLAELHAQAIISDAEFAAAKAKLLT